LEKQKDKIVIEKPNERPADVRRKKPVKHSKIKALPKTKRFYIHLPKLDPSKYDETGYEIIEKKSKKSPSSTAAQDIAADWSSSGM
jgi:hypothetical protein